MLTDIPDHIAAWINLQIADKRFRSIEDLLTHLVALDQPIVVGMAWARPLLDAADEQVQRGETVSSEEAFTRAMATL